MLDQTEGLGPEACQFCQILAGGDPRLSQLPCNQLIFETPRFVMIPALGPLTLGHVLLVTRTHSEGLLYAPSAVQAAHKELVHRLRAHLAKKNVGLLEVEHGGESPGSARPCISHTHVNLLPGLTSLSDAFEGLLPRLNHRPSGSYIWVRDGVGDKRYDASTLPGQAVRRVLAARLGMEDWDWLVTPNMRLLAESVAFWGTI